MTNIELEDDQEETNLPSPPDVEHTDSVPLKPLARRDLRLQELAQEAFRRSFIESDVCCELDVSLRP